MIACAVGATLMLSILLPDDLDRVEAEVDRLADLARKGGPEAAAEILAAFADDYRGSVSLDTVERYVKRHVERGGVDPLTLGNFKTFWEGSEIRIPLLTIRTKVFPHPVILTVTFGERDGAWKITSARRASWGR